MRILLKKNIFYSIHIFIILLILQTFLLIFDLNKIILHQFFDFLANIHRKMSYCSHSYGDTQTRDSEMSTDHDPQNTNSRVLKNFYIYIYKSSTSTGHNF
jgi:hypothetical protein